MSIGFIAAFAVVVTLPGLIIITFWPEQTALEGAPYFLSVVVLSVYTGLCGIASFAVAMMLHNWGEHYLKCREAERSEREKKRKEGDAT